MELGKTVNEPRDDPFRGIDSGPQSTAVNKDRHFK